MKPTSSSTLMESMSLLSSMAVTLCLNHFGRDLNIFLTTFEFGIGYPRLKEQLTIYHLIQNKKKNGFDFHVS